MQGARLSRARSHVRNKRLHRLLFVLMLVPLLVVGFFYLCDLITGVVPPYRWTDTPHPRYPELGLPWRMHPLDNPGDWLPNGLDQADVNGDGRVDFVVNYEWTGRIRVLFHPGPSLSPDQPWPATDAGRVPNAESAAFGDLDGDGRVDIVVAHGVEHTDVLPGVRVLWGAGPQHSGATPGGFSWADGGDIPTSQGGWHFLYVRTADLDQDEDLDIVVGGRSSRLAGEERTSGAMAGLNWAGLRWLENPRSQGGDPRDLSRWSIHPIDPYVPSGHGFVLADLNSDGLLDLVLNNADWDTLDEEEAVVVYRNPGLGTDRYRPWPRVELYRSPEFYGKEQVAVADLNGDGRPDILAQAEDFVHLFWNKGGVTWPAFRHQAIEKPPALRWRSRALTVADLNGDARPDIIGAAIHRNGLLPRDIAAVWWLEQGENRWMPHVIKWGSGFLGLGAFNGEKWDQILPMDVDNDGDLDLVANVEEFNRLTAVLAVVWFEAPSQ